MGKMFDFLAPTYVIIPWSNYGNQYTFLCTVNQHFVGNLRFASRFYFKFTATRALRKYVRFINSCCDREVSKYDYDIVDYRELGYSYEDASLDL